MVNRCETNHDCPLRIRVSNKSFHRFRFDWNDVGIHVWDDTWTTTTVVFENEGQKECRHDGVFLSRWRERCVQGQEDMKCFSNRNSIQLNCCRHPKSPTLRKSSRWFEPFLHHWFDFSWLRSFLFSEYNRIHSLFTRWWWRETCVYNTENISFSLQRAAGAARRSSSIFISFSLILWKWNCIDPPAEIGSSQQQEGLEWRPE